MAQFDITERAFRRDGSSAKPITMLRRATCLIFLAATLWATNAQAQNCSDYVNGTLDGFAGDIAPAQLFIDRNCTIKNYPASNPLTTNFSFFTQPGQNQDRWLVVFDNVVHNGQMSCNLVSGHIIWFVNGSSTSIQDGCQNLLIPVEKIDKQNPPGQTTASIGVPFTYTLTIPVLFDAGTGNVINEFGSPNELHSVTITDDLNETGVDLTYLGHVAYWKDTGTPVSHSFTNSGGVLGFDIAPIIPADTQIIIEITVVLDETPVNVPGTQFVNTAKWEFGRLIDGVFYAPLPGEWGISEPLTIAAPALVFTKTGPATMNLGQSGDFTLDIQNTGLGDAWNATILDRIPDGATGGMCDTTPTILSAQVFAADGVTPIAGKGPLIPGTDFSFNYNAAPTCELSLTALTAAATIGATERLIINYRTELDADTQDGIPLTNVAGATQWFNGDSSNADRQVFTRTLTDGTVGVLDHEDAYTVIVDLSGYFFEKSVANLTTGVDPTATAAPGDTLRYTLRVQTTDNPLDNFTVFDDLGALNAIAAFETGTLTLVAGTIPPGADTSNTNPNGGTNGSGILDVRGMSLPAASQLQFQFDITLNAALLNGTVVTNQADLVRTTKLADSDDPNINGQADPDVPGDEDPTRVLIEVTPPPALEKANTQTTAAVGEEFSYLVTVPTTPHTAPLYDVRILDDLSASAADLQFVSVAKVSGSEPWTPVNTGTATNLVIEDPVNGIDIPVGEQIVVEITVLLLDTITNVAGLTFTNTASYTYNLIDGNDISVRPGDPGTTPPMTIVEPELTLEKSGPLQMYIGAPGTFTLNVHNIGSSPAYNLTITDILPNQADGNMCDAAPAAVTAQLFQADGTTPVAAPLTEGTDFTVTFNGNPVCSFTLTTLTPAATIGVDERLIVSYQVSLDANAQPDAVLTNIAGATEWHSTDISAPGNEARVYTRTLTDGTVGVLDHEDAHTVVVITPTLIFEKSVANLTTGVDPTATAAPGDTLRYTLRVQTTDNPLDNFTIFDDLGELNALAVFEPGTLTLVAGTIPPGADTSNTDPNGGTNGAGILDVRNMSLPAASELQIQFDITLNAALLDGTVVTNQADLVRTIKLADSDDPNVNGPADPAIDGDEDPTRVLIEVTPPPALEKANTQTTAAVGEEFSYQITVPTTPHTTPLYDVRILDDLGASAADLQFVSVAKVSGSEPWTPVNTGTATNIVIEDPVIGIDIPAGEQIVVEITVLLLDTITNVAGLTFTNTASYTYNLVDGNDISVRPGGPGTSPPMTIVEPELTLEKSGPLQMRIGVPGTFTLDVHNTGSSPAYNLNITDILPNQADGNMCDAAPAAITAQLFEADGTTPVAPPLTAGTDFAVTFNGDPACTFTLTTLTTAAAIGPDERLIVSYEASLDANAQQDAILTNIAGATEWFSLDVSIPGNQARTYTRTLTDGTVGVLDHEDAHTVLVFTPTLIFEKTAINVSSGEDPATVASPGDTLRYRLRVENAIDSPLSNFSIADELDRLNAIPVFQAGTLNVITLPAGADASNTDPNGGAAGTGLLDIGNLSLGGIGDSLLIEFEVVLAPIIANGTYVTNQSEILRSGVPVLLSDDPNINGPADPTVDGDEDPTRILIQSAPEFTIEKISSYITGDPSVLLAGETLRYTITVQNVGTDNATNVVLVDQIPTNTSYVAGSTTLNAAAVADPGAGISPLTDGILINAPQDLTPGAMNVGVANNVATIVFDVIVNLAVPDGTVISNQAFVSAVDHGIADLPSDDPRTSIIDDPTRDIVGILPLLYAEKSATLQIDAGSPGIVDPGDVLRYTIAIYNNGTVPATGVELVDNVPANTTYIADSVTLNGLAVGQPDGGVFPLAAGIPVSSSDLTPPLPGTGQGTINPGQSAIVQFDLQVNAAVPAGTLITNQAVAGSNELPNLPTDGDGDPTTGPEPTVIVVGDTQQLTITKDVMVVNSGPALAGSTLEYVVTVRNPGTVAAVNVVIIDDLDDPVAGHLSYVSPSATMNGLPTGVSFAGSTLTADYANVYGALDPGETVTLRFRAVIDPGLALGTTVTNVAQVAWNSPQQTASASVSIAVGGIPGSGTLGGTLWHDSNFDDLPDSGERLLEGWTVTLLVNGQPVRTVLTDTGGNYSIPAVPPNDLGSDQYALQFSAPGAGIRTALLGEADSVFTNSLQRIDDIVVTSGSVIPGLNLPIDPNGVIYNSVGRAPIAGATVTLVDGGSGIPVPNSCFDDAGQQDQVTLADGYYKFDINFSGPGCPSNGNYVINVTAPGSAFDPGPSQLIPPTSDQSTLPFDVPACPGSAADIIIATGQHCEVQVSEFAPPTSVPARSIGTAYHAHLTLDDGQVPGSSQLFNNHIPLDPVLSGTLAITKTTPMINVTRGQLVPYSITMNGVLGIQIPDVTIIDRFPAGFRYVEGSARIDGVETEPVVAGRELTWSGITIPASGRLTIQLLLAVGSAVTEGEFVNRAQAFSSLTGGAMSEEAAAAVRLIPDPTIDCTDVTGKVFDDANLNGYQDQGEEGVAGVRLVTTRGLAAVTDSSGRYHITCAITPHESRGSNFILKLDDRTLPSGFRVSTRPVQIKRATRGKALRLNFGTSIHRVIGLDLADAVFVPGQTEMRDLWKPRIALLVKELQNGPAILRLSYVADIEEEQLVDRRLQAVQREITDAWDALSCCYELIVEPEVYWRLGAPPDTPDVREAEDR